MKGNNFTKTTEQVLNGDAALLNLIAHKLVSLKSKDKTKATKEERERTKAELDAIELQWDEEEKETRKLARAHHLRGIEQEKETTSTQEKQKRNLIENREGESRREIREAIAAILPETGERLTRDQIEKNQERARRELKRKMIAQQTATSQAQDIEEMRKILEAAKCEGIAQIAIPADLIANAKKRGDTTTFLDQVYTLPESGRINGTLSFKESEKGGSVPALQYFWDKKLTDQDKHSLRYDSITGMRLGHIISNNYNPLLTDYADVAQYKFNTVFEGSLDNLDNRTPAQKREIIIEDISDSLTSSLTSTVTSNRKLIDFLYTALGKTYMDTIITTMIVDSSDVSSDGNANAQANYYLHIILNAMGTSSNDRKDALNYIANKGTKFVPNSSFAIAAFNIAYTSNNTESLEAIAANLQLGTSFSDINDDNLKLILQASGSSKVIQFLETQLGQNRLCAVIRANIQTNTISTSGDALIYLYQKGQITIGELLNIFKGVVEGSKSFEARLSYISMAKYLIEQGQSLATIDQTKLKTEITNNFETYITSTNPGCNNNPTDCANTFEFFRNRGLIDTAKYNKYIMRNKGIVKHVIDNNISINGTRIDAAYVYAPDPYHNRTVLMDFTGDAEMTSYLLQDLKNRRPEAINSTVNFNNDGRSYSTLTEACDYEYGVVVDPEAIKLLITNGAKTNQVSLSNTTPLSAVLQDVSGPSDAVRMQVSQLLIVNGGLNDLENKPAALKSILTSSYSRATNIFNYILTEINTRYPNFVTQSIIQELLNTKGLNNEKSLSQLSNDNLLINLWNAKGYTPPFNCLPAAPSITPPTQGNVPTPKPVLAPVGGQVPTSIPAPKPTSFPVGQLPTPRPTTGATPQPQGGNGPRPQPSPLPIGAPGTGGSSANTSQGGGGFPVVPVAAGAGGGAAVIILLAVLWKNWNRIKGWCSGGEQPTSQSSGSGAQRGNNSDQPEGAAQLRSTSAHTSASAGGVELVVQREGNGGKKAPLPGAAGSGSRSSSESDRSEHDKSDNSQSSGGSNEAAREGTQGLLKQKTPLSTAQLQQSPEPTVASSSGSHVASVLHGRHPSGGRTSPNVNVRI